MPSLNVAKYIEQCMESVLNQTLKDIEIIAVDAGSTDGTLEILRKYESRDHRVRVIHSDKRSYGYQVNLGISSARGDYVAIVETDDYIEKNMYESLYNLAIQSKADYVKGSAVRFLELEGCKKYYYSEIKVFTQNEFTKNNGAVTVNPSLTPELILKDYYLWTGIFRNDFIKSIRLNETAGAAYQDIGFLMQTFYKAKKAIYIDKIFYYYRQDNPNASGYNPKAFNFILEEYKHVDNLLQGQDEIWFALSACKMFRQTNQRIKLMAISGGLWDSALDYLQLISNKLKKFINKNPKLIENLTSKEVLELDLMIQDPKKLYDYHNIAETKKYGEFSALLEHLSSAKQVVVFGCGILGTFVLPLLELNRIDTIEAYCDNNSDLWGKELQGRPIISPAEVVKCYPKATYLIANKDYSQEIKKQLISMGMAADNIYEYTLGADSTLLSKIYLNN